MKSDARAHLDRAFTLLERSDACLTSMASQPLAAEDAARAAFHAAKALISERGGGASKKHGSVHRAFENITAGDAAIDETLRNFLSESHEFKRIGDYGVDPTEFTRPAMARTAVAEAKRFVSVVAALLP